MTIYFRKEVKFVIGLSILAKFVDTRKWRNTKRWKCLHS